MSVVRQGPPRLAIAVLCAVTSAASAQQPTVPPGEPTSLYATGLRSPRGMAFSLTGDLFVADPAMGVIWRVTSGRVLSTWVTFAKALMIARDGFGDLLVTTGGDTIYRLTPERTRSVFAVGSGVTGIIIGPDGDVWTGSRGALVRYSPLGARVSSIPLPSGCTGAVHLAMSPTHVMHFVAEGCAGVYRILNGFPDLVIAQPDLGALAFDAHGWLWVIDKGRRTALLYDPGYQLRQDPFATRVNGLGTIAFLRSVNGMTSRLLATADGTPSNLSIVEMNPNGMGAPGAATGIDLRVDGAIRPATHGAAYRDTVRVLNVSTATTLTRYSGALPPGITLRSNGELTGTPTATGVWAFSVIAQSGDRLGFGRVVLTVNAADQPSMITVVSVLLGVPGAQLSPAMVQLLDQQGNHNNLLDIGDLRAFVRTQGQLP
jgi:hypothetical protein